MRRLVAFRYNNDMRGAANLVVSLAIVITATALQVACAPADDHPAPQDGGPDASDASGNSAPTYAKNVQPIFKAKCAPCHDGQGLGNHNIAASYDDVQKLMPDTAFDAPMECWKDTDRMMPKTIGECAVIAARLGWMPYQGGCGGAMPANPSACVTASELEILDKWVGAGMPK